MAKSNEEIFSFRIVDADHYVTKPNKFMDISYSSLYKEELNQVPILRIFGVTKFGQKCCIHIHQVYPYIYIKYAGSLDPEKVHDYMIKLFHAINQVLNMTNSNSKTKINLHHVYNIELIQGIPFYGFYHNYEHFLKISLLNPDFKKKLITALEKGLIFGKVFQPYEGHIPFKLQAFIDNYLSGFDFIHLKNIHFRYPIYEINRNYSYPNSYFYTEKNVSKEYKWPVEINIKRESFCELELDASVYDILNRDMIASERPKEALIDFSKNYNEKFKYVPSLRSIWEEENERRKNLNQEEIYTIKKTIRDPVNPHEWCCTNRYQEMLDDALKKFKHEKLNFNSIFREYENNEVRTAFQANMKYNGEKKLLYSLVSLPEEPVSLDNIVLISSNSNEGQSSKSYSDDISSSLKKSLNLSSRNDSNCNAEQTYRKEENLEDELNEEDIYGAYDFLDAYDEINNDNDDNDNNDDNNNDNQINYIKDEEEIDPNEFSILNDEFISLSSPNILNNNNSNNSNNNNNRHQNNKNSISESNYFIPQFDGADDSYIIIDDDDSDVNISKNDIEKPKNNNKHINKRKYNIIDTKSDNEKVKIFKGINSKILQYNKEINKSKNQIINSKSPPKLNCKINKNKHYNSKENIIEILSDDTIISETDESLIKSDDEIQRKKLIKRRMKKLPNDKESSNNNIKINEVKQLSIEIESSGIGDKNSSHDNHSSENIITKSLSNTEKLLRNSDTETQQSKIIKNDDVTIEEFDSFFISPTLLSISSFSPKLKSPTINNTDNDNNLNKEDEVSKNEKSPKKEEILTIKSNDVSTKSYFYKFYVCPPSKNILLNTMSLYNIPETVYQEPFFSNDKDAKDVIILDGYKKILSERESNQEFYTNDCMINDYLNLNQSKEKIKGIDYWKNIQYYKEIINDLNKHKFITPLQKPPSKKYLLNKNKKENSAKIINSVNERIKEDIKEKYKWKPYKYYISQLNMELFAHSRNDLLPNPESDAIIAIFYCFFYDDESLSYTINGMKEGYHVGIILNENEKEIPDINLKDISIKKVSNEISLIEEFVNIVINLDPDILSGYEIQNSSWGYFFQRVYKVYSKNLTKYFSRITTSNLESSFDQEKDEWGYKKTSSIHIPGRIVLNIWRLMKAEYDLISYSIENITNIIFKERIPHYTSETLMQWYESDNYHKLYRLFNYYITRVQYGVAIIQKSNIINKTCEFARIFGVLFFECISRGSQYKIESMLLRIIKPENFIVVSPSKQQVQDMRAIECIPLVMEPNSNFYTSPVIVLDFQSLYPSIIIAYNYCYSTCLGRIEQIDNEYHFGVTKYKISHEVVELLKEYINISPNGNMYLKKNIRKGALSKMLSEILETRVLVKSAMKELSFIKELVRVLDGKQMGLKYIANTTYGYTGASFSGRMPCVDISDDIVQTGREILEKSVKFIESNEKWNAKVIYGDTDSLFVLLPNASKETAFKTGKEICDEITSRNLDPVKLKFEKVYLPCILITKKRYVGYKFEKLDDKPELEGKGIEIIRRDGCPLTQRIMRECLDILFKSRDLSKLKLYLNYEWQNVIQEKIPLKEFIISKAVKLGKYGESHIPPSALIALEKMKHDPRSNPQYGERVPFVVIYKGPNSPLKDCIISPEKLLVKIGYKIHSTYYIMKQVIPALNRLFKIIGLDISQWYKKMPKIQTIDIYTNSQRNFNQYKGVSTIDKYYLANNCTLCNSYSGKKYFCKNCLEDYGASYCKIYQNLNQLENEFNYLKNICRKCSKITIDIDIEDCCFSMDCPILYYKQNVKKRLKVMYQIYKNFINCENK